MVCRIMIGGVSMLLSFIGNNPSIEAFSPCRLPSPSSIPNSSYRPTFPNWQPRHPYLLHADATESNDATEAKNTEEEATDNVEPPESEISSNDESDILNSPAFLHRKVEVLETDLAALEKEIEEENAVYISAKAEWGPKFDDLDKESQMIQERMYRESEEANAMATMDVARKMLDVIDNYDRAFNSIDPANDEEKEIADAYKTTYEMILDTLAGLNVTKVETVGAEFDYELHQAIMQLPSDEYAEGIVCSEFAPGWVLGDKLIRAAVVGVSAG